MKTQGLILSLLMALTGCPLLAAETNSELKQVADALRPIIEKLQPKADFISSADSLTVTYRPQAYKVHNRAMTGEISTNVYETIGPSFEGFILRAAIQSTGETNQADTPCTNREPYWQTDLNITPLQDNQKQIYWALSYGSRTDRHLLVQIRRTLSDWKIIHDDPDAEPENPIRRPAISAEEALVKAQNYVQAYDIIVTNSYIDSIVLNENPRGDKGKFWRVTWEKSKPVKGGSVMVDVSMDGSISHVFGR